MVFHQIQNTPLVSCSQSGDIRKCVEIVKMRRNSAIHNYFDALRKGRLAARASIIASFCKMNRSIPQQSQEQYDIVSPLPFPFIFGSSSSNAREKKRSAASKQSAASERRRLRGPPKLPPLPRPRWSEVSRPRISALGCKPAWLSQPVSEVQGLVCTNREISPN